MTQQNGTEKKKNCDKIKVIREKAIISTRNKSKRKTVREYFMGFRRTKGKKNSRAEEMREKNYQKDVDHGAQRETIVG